MDAQLNLLEDFEAILYNPKCLRFWGTYIFSEYCVSSYKANYVKLFLKQTPLCKILATSDTDCEINNDKKYRAPLKDEKCSV